MPNSLVIVESPTKARTLTRFLGSDVKVMASMGHVRDLPESSLGVDIHNRFTPIYVLTGGGKKVIGQLKREVRKADAVYLATDPDREGEAIAWHLYEELKRGTKAAFHRVTFHEITRNAILRAFEHPSELDLHKIDAQQARRVLDRIVGYQVSPMLWKAVQKGTSAGRVQSVALRLVCERQREIDGFTPVEYWNMIAKFGFADCEELLTAKLYQLDGKKPKIGDGDTANTLAEDLGSGTFRVADVGRKPRSRRAPPPFITSTLQQAAGSLRMSTSQTMRIAQQLYEGIEAGSEGAVGLITYMRTDSVAVAKEAQAAAREFIGSAFGPDYVPPKPNVYRSRGTAQEAHEAIRPTDVTRTPEKVEKYLSPQQSRLYRLIWNRFVASQMSPARMIEHTIDVESVRPAGSLRPEHHFLFRASATTTTFPGFLKVYDVKEETGKAMTEEEAAVASSLPELDKGTGCALAELEKQQKFTEPPPQFSEATLVRELEQNGVGRPSTYATIVNTIQQRKYAVKERGKLAPTPLGYSVNDYLTENLDDLFKVDFTARMEKKLDSVEEGDVEWTAMLDAFYAEFVKWVGGVPATVGAPTEERVRALMATFPEDLDWAPPVKRGRRTYDDAKFFASLRKQVDDGKPFSDRQWQALLALAARYADKIGNLDEVADELNVRDAVDALIRKRKEAEEKGRSPDNAKSSAPDPRDIALLDVLKDIEFEPPTRRGKRRYDDKEFYLSLRGQAEEGKKLSDAQLNAARRLIGKYEGQIGNFADVAAKFGLEPLERKAASSSADEIKPLVDMLGEVRTWQPPRKTGRRTYDDAEFAQSVTDQFRARNGLSDRQVAAIKRMLVKYHEQIPGYGERAGALGLAPPPPTAAEINQKCPDCGGAIVARSARGRQFFGCTNFPKCRFTTRDLASLSSSSE